MLMDVANDVGMFVLEIVKSHYPPPQRVRGTAPSPLRTPKQKAWFWYWMNQIAQGNKGAAPESLRGWVAAYKTVEGRKTLVIDPNSGYIRTGSLVRGISFEIRVTDNAVIIAVGPGLARTEDEGIMSYAEYVIGLPPPAGNQARYHQGNWTPLEQLVQDNSEAIYEFMMETTFNRLNGLIGGTGLQFT
jgi:hypothetical protein